MFTEVCLLLFSLGSLSWTSHMKTGQAINMDNLTINNKPYLCIFNAFKLPSKKKKKALPDERM